jgi:MoxR-like ATPase
MVVKDTRTITQIFFSRKREVDIFPRLHGRQEIDYPARRNPKTPGYLSAMLCKSCVVALKNDIIGITKLEPPGVVMIRSRSQTGSDFHHCYMTEGKVWLPRGNVTYHLGLLALAEGLAFKESAPDLLDALEELLSYRESFGEADDHYLKLLMHLSDELYYYAKWRDGNPETDAERLDCLEICDSSYPPEVVLGESIDPDLLTDVEKLQRYREDKDFEDLDELAETTSLSSRFKGPQLGELVESLDLGMHCLLVGPTATGKSLCAFEAFERTRDRKSVFVIEGHESLKEFDLLGGYTPDGKESFAWHDGILIRAMKAGGYLFIDEANRMPTRTLNILLGVISRGAVVLTEHGSKEIRIEKGFQVVMAMNLGKGYSVNTLDTALLNRFSCVLEYRYLSAKDEEKLLVKETDIDPAIAVIMVKVAGETRRLKRNKELSGEITPRGLFAWATKFKAKKGKTIPSRLKSAAKVTWMHQVAGTDSDGYVREDTKNMLLHLIDAHTPKE